MKPVRPVAVLGAVVLAATMALLFAGPQAVSPVEAVCKSFRQPVALENLLQSDGRINQIAHFGGDALFCVDADGNPTNDYEKMAEIRLLNAEGQVLWSLPAESILASVADAEASGDDQVVGTGDGSFGTGTLSVIETGDVPTFEFSGYDEFEKLNSVQFQGCQAVGPAAPEPSSPAAVEEAPSCYQDVACVGYVPVPCGEAQGQCFLDVNDQNQNSSTTDYICGGDA